MNRRHFVSTVGSAFALTGVQQSLGQGQVPAAAQAGVNGEPFKVQFAPSPRHFGKVKTGEDYLAALQKAYDYGFRAWEDNRLPQRSAEDQEKVGDFLKDKGMTMGVSVVTTGNGKRWFDPTEEVVAQALADCKSAVEVAKRVGHKWLTLVPGARDEAQPYEPQLEGAVDLMKRCCDVFDEAGLIFVLEPLSHKVGGQPPLLRTFKEGADLCRMVDRPSCKLLADYYHQQQMGGDLIKNTDDHWDQIAYVQYGDVPGRKQPGTGEINYANVTRHIREKGFTGIYGMEHAIEGSFDDLVRSYREIDAAL